MRYVIVFALTRKRTLRHRKTSGFTLIELLVVIAVIALLAAILVPAFSETMITAGKIDDTARIKSVGQALYAFIMDENGMVPQAYLSQRATASDTAQGGDKNGHLAWVLRSHLGGTNLQNKQVHPAFTSSVWLRRMGASNDTQLWMDTNYNNGIYRYVTHRWTTSTNTVTGLFPFPYPGTSQGGVLVRHSIDAIAQPSSTWALTDADADIRSYMYLTEPVHKDVRITLYWDGSATKVPVADFHEGGPDP